MVEWSKYRRFFCFLATLDKTTTKQTFMCGLELVFTGEGNINLPNLREGKPEKAFVLETTVASTVAPCHWSPNWGASLGG